MKDCSTQSRIIGTYYYTRGYKTGPQKTEAVINLERPKDKKQGRKFLGMVQYYSNLWQKRSEILAPLTELTKVVPTKNGSTEWTPACTKEFWQMKSLITKKIIKAYPNF